MLRSLRRGGGGGGRRRGRRGPLRLRGGNGAGHRQHACGDRTKARQGRTGQKPALAGIDAAPLSGYNAEIGDTSISGISSGAFMAVQFGTAWSSVIKGVGVIAGGPYWCAQADADDIMNNYMLPMMHATGSCMVGPPPDLKNSYAKAEAKAASGD